MDAVLRDNCVSSLQPVSHTQFAPSFGDPSSVRWLPVLNPKCAFMIDVGGLGHFASAATRMSPGARAA